MLSQTVLLKGVNDDADTLAALMRAFVEARVESPITCTTWMRHRHQPLPHQPCRGPAADAGLRGRLSGIAQPTYVLDIPGGHGKVPVGPDYLSDEGRAVTDPSGTLHDLSERGDAVHASAADPAPQPSSS